MMITKRWTAISLVMLSMTFGSTVSLAQKGWGERRDHAERPFKHMIEKLDLTAEQKAKIQEIEQTRQAESQVRRQAMQELRKNFHEASHDPSLTESQLRELHENLIEAQGNMMRARFEHMLQIRSVLDEEQRQAFRELMQDRRSKHHMRRGPRSE